MKCVVVLKAAASICILPFSVRLSYESQHFFQLKGIYLYSDLCFGVNWAPLKDLNVFTQPQIGCFSWRSFGRPHTVALFPIKKPFCRGSSGSHASKYIHFHRKCFVLEVQCFLGLLCSHSTQVGFLSNVCWTPTPLHRPYNGEYKQNLSPAHIFLTRYGLIICEGSAPEKTKQRSRSLLCLEAVCECMCVFASLRMLQANKQDTGKHKPTGKPATKVKLCGKTMTDVYSLAHSWNATSLQCVLTAVSLRLCFLFFCAFSQVFKSWCKNLGRRRRPTAQPMRMEERVWREYPERDDRKVPRHQRKWLQ